MALPPRSPDLTQMDFFLWSHFKALIYSLPVDFEEYLIACLVKAAVIIRQQPSIFEHTSVSAVLSAVYQGRWLYYV